MEGKVHRVTKQLRVASMHDMQAAFSEFSQRDSRQDSRHTRILQADGPCSIHLADSRHDREVNEAFTWIDTIRQEQRCARLRSTVESLSSGTEPRPEATRRKDKSATGLLASSSFEADVKTKVKTPTLPDDGVDSSFEAECETSKMPEGTATSSVKEKIAERGRLT